MEEERIARALFERMRAAVACDVQLHGEGVHWSVKARSPTRECEVHCFSYRTVPADIQLGLNLSNQRASGAPLRKIRSGAEYCCVIFADDQMLATGRTDGVEEAIACVRTWIDRGLDLAGIQEELPFVNEPVRRMQDLISQIQSRTGSGVRCAIEQSELWIYGAGRSCLLEPVDDGRVACRLWIGQAQVAYGDATEDPAGVVTDWLVEGLSLREMSTLCGLRVENHAEVLEAGDAARWHWLHVEDRLRDPEDVLALSKPLVEAALKRPAIKEFFSFTSHYFLCLSASSHYPWVREGLPTIKPLHEAKEYIVEVGSIRERCTVSRAIDLLEATLTAYPRRPFFGSAPCLTVDPLNAELAAQGSSLRAELVQRRQWFDCRVIQGGRSCVVDTPDLRSVSFESADTGRHTKKYADSASAVTAIRHWLETGCTLQDL